MGTTSFYLKSNFAQILNWSRLPQFAIARSRWKIILAFHRVVPRGKASELGLHPSLFVTPETFRTVLSSMKQIGDFLDIHTLLACNPARTSFSVTFDDGWIDTYTMAYPILKELNIPFTIFIATSLVENDKMNWTEEVVAQYVKTINASTDRAKKAITALDPGNNSTQPDIYNIVEKLKEIPYGLRKMHIEKYYNEINNDGPIKGEMLSWIRIKELCEKGVTIGSHTHSHSILRDLHREEVTEELSISKNIIQSRLGIDAKMFCFPNGQYKKENEDIFRSLGFNNGFILDDKRIPADVSPYFIPRFLVYEDIIKLLYFRFLTEHK